MEAGIAPLVSRAIGEYIKESPVEIVQAIAPEIAKAVQEQNRLDREEMVKVLSPMIDQIIHNKTEQDKKSMSAAIAPVISPAITQQIKVAPEEVANAIMPEIATAVKKQIKLERTAMIDALYPIIGNTIGKYIGETIRDINRKIENALTLKGIKRKIRAIGLALAALIALPWGIHQYRNGVDRRQATVVADALAAAPSLSVYRLHVIVDRGTLKLTGRVPSEHLCGQAEAIARAAAPTLELENNIIAVEVPPDPKQTATELHRVTIMLNQIDGITITTKYVDGQVTVTGVVVVQNRGREDSPSITANTRS